MTRRIGRISLVLAIVMLISSVCVAYAAPAVGGTLTVNVSFPEMTVSGKSVPLYGTGASLSDVSVTYTAPDGTVTDLGTPKNGKVSLDKCPVGEGTVTVKYNGGENSVPVTVKAGTNASVKCVASTSYLGGQVKLGGLTVNSYGADSASAERGTSWKLINGERDSAYLSRDTYVLQNGFTGMKYYVEGVFDSTRKYTLKNTFGGLLIANDVDSGTFGSKFGAAINGDQVLVLYSNSNFESYDLAIVANYSTLGIDYDPTSVKLGVLRDGTTYWFFVNDVYVGKYVLADISASSAVGLYAAGVASVGVTDFVYTDNSAFISALKASVPEIKNKQIDVYLIGGQSNAVGCTAFNHTTLENIDSAYISGRNNIYYAGMAGGNYSRLTLARAGTGEMNTYMGPEVGMAEALSKYYNPETGKVAAIIKAGVGGTNLLDYVTSSNTIAGNWVSPSYKKTLSPASVTLTGGLYNRFIKEVETQLAVLRSLGYEPVIKGMYWMQGESDRDFPNVYLTAFKYFVSDIRSDLTKVSGQDCSNMPMFVGEISKTFASAEPAHVSINTAFVRMQQTMPNNISNLYVLANSDYAQNMLSGNGNVVFGSDSYHWYYTDNLTIARNVGETMYAKTH